MTGQQRPWAQFLVDRLKAVEHVQWVLFASNGAHVLGSDSQSVVAAAREVLPAALDVLEVLAAARPGEVACALAANAEARAQRRGRVGGRDLVGALPHLLPGLQFDRRVKDLLKQHGRGRLEGVLGRLLQDGAKGRAAGEGEPWGDEEKEDMARRLVGGSCNVAWLPFPGCGDREGGMVLPPRCANGWCSQVGCPTFDAGWWLRSCGRCRAVRYCCEQCQKEDWVAGHKAVCGRAAGEQQQA